MAIQSNRPPIFGMNCTQCGDLLIAPEWSEYEDERHEGPQSFAHPRTAAVGSDTEALLPAAKAVSDAATINVLSVAVVFRRASALQPIPRESLRCHELTRKAAEGSALQGKTSLPAVLGKTRRTECREDTRKRRILRRPIRRLDPPQTSRSYAHRVGSTASTA